MVRVKPYRSWPGKQCGDARRNMPILRVVQAIRVHGLPSSDPDFALRMLATGFGLGRCWHCAPHARQTKDDSWSKATYIYASTRQAARASRVGYGAGRFAIGRCMDASEPIRTGAEVAGATEEGVTVDWLPRGRWRANHGLLPGPTSD